MKNIALALILVLFSCQTAFSKQYDVPSYYKERTINGKECVLIFSYHDGKEHYEDTICN